MHPPLRTATATLTLLLACGGDPGDTTDTTGSTGPAGSTSAEPSTSAAPTTTPDPTTTTTPDPTTTTTTPDPTADSTTTTADPSDPTATTGPPATGCADLPLCEDFEAAAVAGPPDPATWTVTSPNCSGAGTLAVADDQAHSGAQALRIAGGGGYCDHVFIAHSAAIKAVGPQVYGRFWLRLDAALGQGHVTFMTLRDSNDAGGKDLRMGGQSQILMWNRESDDATLPSLSPAGIALSLAPTPQQWTCVEFMIDQDSAELRTWIDGSELAGLVVDAEPTPDVDQQWHNKPDWKPVLEDIKLGWESYAGQTMVLHVDDIALASARIGCD